MAHRPDPSRESARARRAQEHAFTLIELLVVLVIVAAVTAILIRSHSSTSASTMRRSAIGAARSYGDAIDDFRKDHGGRPPVLGDAKDWPTGSAAKGPRNTSDGRAYLRGSAPEAVGAKQAQLVGASASTTNGARFALQYAPVAATPGGWVIVVRDQRSQVKPCYVQGGAATPPAGMQLC